MSLPVSYTAEDGRTLNGLLHVPPGPGPHPVVLLVPGGGWRICVPGRVAHWGAWLASKGLAAFCIEHATSGAPVERPFEAAVGDLRSALRYVVHHGAAQALDAQRVAILGESSGATLAFLLALGGTAELPPVKGAVGIYGTYDMAARWRSQLAFNEPAGQGLCTAFLGADLYEDRQRYFDASPISRVSYKTCRDLRVMLVWGESDPIVPPAEQSERFAQMLREARNAVTTLNIPGAGHFWFQTDPVDEPGSPNALLAPRLARFLQATLSAPGA